MQHTNATPPNVTLWSRPEPTRLRKAGSAAREAAGIDKPDEKYGETLTIHHIRHTWATALGDSGATLAQLMAAGGWKTATVAMRYMKRKETQSAEAARLLARR